MRSSFSARFQISGESRILLGVLVDVDAESITVTSANREIVRWSLDEIEVSHLPDGFHIRGANEEGVLSVTEPTGFASAVGVAGYGSTGRREPGRHPYPRGGR